MAAAEALPERACYGPAGHAASPGDLAPTVAVRAPGCHYAAIAAESGAFVLLMEDISPSEHGDQIAGCTPEQARDAVLNLTGLYGPATETFIADLDDLLGDLLDERDQWSLRECVEMSETWALARSECFTLVHGDYRLDNLLFPSAGADQVVAVDWQTRNLGLPARGRGIQPGRLLGRLPPRHDPGTAGVGFGYAYGTRSERGERMFAAMVTRACDAIREHDTVALAKARAADNAES